MAPKNILAALAVVVTWGLNFAAMKTAFLELKPFLFLFLRLAVTVFPMIFFFPRPKASWGLLFWIAIFQWILHFSLLFSAMYLGLSGGISALLMQCQVIFTMILTAIFFKTTPTKLQVLGVSISFSGLVLLTTHGDCSANMVAVILLVGAALTVAVTNLLFKSTPKDDNMASVILWSSLIALPQSGLLVLAFEGWEESWSDLMQITSRTILSMTYTVFLSTMIGIVTWAKLMRSADSMKALPFTLLIPVVALTAGHYLMAEQVAWIDVIASLIIIGGLMINQVSSMRRAAVIRLPEPSKQKEAA